MKKIVVFGIASFALGAFATAHADGLWGHLNGRVGAWGKNKVMKKGFLGGLVKRSAKKHPAFAKLLGDALGALNGQHGKCSGRWPNGRMALANIVAGAAQGAGAALAPALKAFTDAMAKMCTAIGKGGQVAVVDALKGAIAALKGKAKPHFMKKMRIAIGWIKKPNLWAGKAR